MIGDGNTLAGTCAVDKEHVVRSKAPRIHNKLVYNNYKNKNITNCISGISIIRTIQKPYHINGSKVVMLVMAV